MNNTVVEHFDQFIREQVSAGRYQNENEALQDLARHIREQEALKALKAKLDAAVERGGSHTDEEVAAFLAERRVG